MTIQKFDPRARKVKILATIGPASRDPDMLRRLFKAGADAFRVNMSHGEHSVHGETIRAIRALEKEFARPIAILADLQGPKLRVGTFKMSLDKGVPGGAPYIVPKDRVKKVIVESHRQGWQLYLHITNAETFDNAIEAIEAAYRLYPRDDVRHIFTHINMPTEENLEVMKRLGIVADSLLPADALIKRNDTR